jgi:pyrroloquinoline quinone biosynthesis protein B
MRIRVLGAAAGGGFPQWNCACENCELARRGDPRVAPRTQDSIAFFPDGAGGDAVVVNASPDIHAQIARSSDLWPRGPRHTPIRAVVLTNGDLDHVLGLFSLRESQPLVVYATRAVIDGLAERNVVARTLARFDGQVTWRALALGEETPLFGGLSVRAVTAPGKLPVHLVGVAQPSPEDNVALVFSSAPASSSSSASAGAKVAYAASAGALGAWISALDDCDVVFFDGTFWSSDELVRQGLGKSRAEDMAHVPVGGDAGSLARLSLPRARRRIYTHVNNTNPMLREGSAERAALARAGWELAFDGMEVSL